MDHRPFSARARRNPRAPARATRLALCVAAALGLGGAAAVPAWAAATSAPTHAARAHHLNAPDRDFVRHAAGGGHTEVIAGQMALARASDPELKRFGERLVRDHGRADHQLELLGMRLDITPPSGPLPPQQEQIRQLRHLHGAEFDRVFVQTVGVASHEKTIALFRQEADSPDANPLLRHYAQHTLPVLQEHLAIAQGLAQRLGVSEARGPKAGVDIAAAGTTAAATNAGARVGQGGHTASDAQQEVQAAVQVVEHMKRDTQVARLLQKAKGVFILPHYGRAAAGIGVQGGEGVLVTRRAGGRGFGDPAFYDMGGVSVGAQAGASGGVVAFLLMSDRAVQRFRSDGHFSLNADAGLTVVTYSARGEASAGKVSDVVVWSGTKGLYAGASVGVTDVLADRQADRSYYGRPGVTTAQILGGQVDNPHSNVLGMVLAA